MQRLTVVAPVFNDWPSFARLLPDIDAAFAGSGTDVSVVAVDDGSIEVPDFHAPQWTGFQAISRVEILRLTTNVGHQRAIAIGLAHVHQHRPSDVIVMDSDGEDRPSDIASLLNRHAKEPACIVVAERAQRTESLLFRLSYGIYKGCFRMLTGHSIDFGNYCLIPAPLLTRLVYSPDLWNHLAACIVRSRIPLTRVPIDRGTRYAGVSKMNFVSLIVHGLSAISVFSDSLFVRVLLAAAFIVGLAIAVSLGAVIVRVSTDLAVPNWTTTMVGAMAVIFLQAIVLSAGAAFMHLNRRSAALVIPAKTYEDLVLDQVVVPNGQAAAAD